MAIVKGILLKAADLLFSAHPSSCEPSDTLFSNFGKVPELTLLAATAIVVAVISAEANRRGLAAGNLIFYASTLCFTAPIFARLLTTEASRLERLALLLVTGLALFAVRMIHEPAYFVDHDEFLHWATTNDILETGRLFRPNPLLPISAVYPGLEIVTTALVTMSGLSVFSAAILLLLVMRLTFLAALFLLYERLAGSARTASLATFIYMGASSFVFFDTMYSYASLAICLMAVALLADIGYSDDKRSWRFALLVAAPILIALAVTHHLTAYITMSLLTAFLLLDLWHRGAGARARLLPIPFLALASAVSWSMLVGNPSEGYIGPIFERTIEEAQRFLSFGGGRLPFVAEDGSVAPLWQRTITMSSVALLCLGLATSFFRALACAGMPLHLSALPWRLKDFLTWTNSRLVVLTAVTFAYPVSIVLRMTRAGWETGNRIGPFAFLGVGIVIAIGLVTYWYGTSRSLTRRRVFGALGGVLLIAGIISGSGSYILGSDTYRVAADSASIEPMGISAAEWTRTWLGPRNRFVADRINRLLLGTYGRQQVTTTLYDKFDLGAVVLATSVGAPELLAVREASVDYLMLDLRISEQLPLIGWYFDPGLTVEEPPEPAALLKFNTLEGVSRVFDNGFISIADVTKYRDANHED